MYERKIMLGFIRAHILHHASSDNGIYGVWMMNELEEHGYRIGPGTLYPILHEMEKDGVIESEEVNVEGKIRKVYHTTREGDIALERLRSFIRELSSEVLS
jgi:PadR family transcriptional regulator PadR